MCYECTTEKHNVQCFSNQLLQRTICYWSLSGDMCVTDHISGNTDLESNQEFESYFQQKMCFSDHILECFYLKLRVPDANLSSSIERKSMLKPTTPGACQILNPLVIGSGFPQYQNCFPPWIKTIYMLLNHRETSFSNSWYCTANSKRFLTT